MKIRRPLLIGALAIAGVTGMVPASHSSAHSAYLVMPAPQNVNFTVTRSTDAVQPGSVSGATSTNYTDRTIDRPADSGGDLPKRPAILQAMAIGASATPLYPPIPTSSGRPVATGGIPALTSFDGLSHADQRLAGTGPYINTQFSLEPPDQALCVGSGFVLESVNNALQVFNSQGAALTTPIANSQFFGLTPEIDRTKQPPVVGDFVSDPKCLFDRATGRFFLTLLQQDAAPSVRSHTLIAVSQTSNPTGAWYSYRFDTTDDGLNGTPNNAGCPCFGDQPLIGLDSNGLYVTTNEFGNGFNGAQVYAVSKAQLVNGTSSITGEHFYNLYLPDVGKYPPANAYSIQPANKPQDQFNFQDNQSQGGQTGGNNDRNGTEYFLSALQFSGITDNQIAVWALTNTASLNGTPHLSLLNTIVKTEAYGQPSSVTQPDGSRPLSDAFGGLPLPQIQSNDDRMNQVVYAGGTLWGALNTVINDLKGNQLVGTAYFGIQPSLDDNTLKARVSAQGYVSVAGQNVIFPSIAVNSRGRGVIAFSLVGPGYYPSAAYVSMNSQGDLGPIQILGKGVGPEDGFTGYAALDPQDGGVARWGDYSAAVTDSLGTFWLASEYIPGTPRTFNANWGTRVSRVLF
ncbi:MAG: hypothetical protein JWO59_95 [Chloroflexi bacterium]|nr:hypothetical protein [Chloroflexota bacterium]